MGRDLQEQIKERAYQIWLDEGQPEGADLKHWLQAADELAGEDTHETFQELIDEDDREDEVKQRRASKEAEAATSPSVPQIDITTGQKPARKKIRKTEGP